jgi:fatty-acyl-CoA synthase
MMDVSADDRMYNCLPLYHSVGGVVAVGSMLVAGGSVVIRERFSVSRFWDDVAETGCTLFQYIGELCRYLLTGPVNPRERAHRLRLAVGNGLAADVWQAFQHRFSIPDILEFYAATESGLSLYNCEGKVGSIGRIPPFLRDRFGVALIRCDTQTGEPVRGPDGLCEACEMNEAGEAISRLGDGRRFDGYTDAAASDRKLLHDVFAPGDRWFRTGDLMRRDGQGFFYFVDRLGDTFRWKGENVSTTQVAGAVRLCPGVLDAVVYGVAVEGQDGKAGMAAVVVNDDFDLQTLHTRVTTELPAYARPLYIRICQSLDMTSTFKLTKTTLAREGACCADAVFAYKPVGYVPLSKRTASLAQPGSG